MNKHIPDANITVIELDKLTQHLDPHVAKVALDALAIINNYRAKDKATLIAALMSNPRKGRQPDRDVPMDEE